ncbi:MAG: PspC domain-containing protein [Gammaproteobacteria bacterium]|jgi:phage shock protein C|nr:PspC domain-containing protein [Gammaproteobacteria bacterium]
MKQKGPLRLSRNRLLLGVCAGLAEWYGVETNFVRLFYLMTSAACVFVPGIVIYLILWMIMRPAEEAAPPQP